jgi:hypothetical protein
MTLILWSLTLVFETIGRTVSDLVSLLDCFCTRFCEAWVFCDVWASVLQIDLFEWHKSTHFVQKLMLKSILLKNQMIEKWWSVINSASSAFYIVKWLSVGSVRAVLMTGYVLALYLWVKSQYYWYCQWLGPINSRSWILMDCELVPNPRLTWRLKVAEPIDTLPHILHPTSSTKWRGAICVL